MAEAVQHFLPYAALLSKSVYSIGRHQTQGFLAESQSIKLDRVMWTSLYSMGSYVQSMQGTVIVAVLFLFWWWGDMKSTLI